MKPWKRMCGIALGLALWTGPAWALSGEEVLGKVDQAEFGAKDSSAVVSMQLVDKDGKTSERKLQMFQKGTGKRLLRFVEPKDIAGTAFLDAGESALFVYLPAFHKVKRVAGHVKNNNFAGTDFSYDDLNMEEFSARSIVREMSEDPEHFVLDLGPKPGSDSQYARSRMWVRKQDFMFDRIEFYDQAGEKWKVLVRKDFRKVGSYVQSFYTEMKDEKRSHRTRTTVKSMACDTGLKDNFFSERQLERQ